jgi:ribonuclease HI
MSSGSSIFCDGACRANGTARAVAGWAWAYWPGRAVGEPAAHDAEALPPPATNQRAELRALLEAIRWWKGLGGGAVTFYTDSMYSLNCMTKWGPGWKKKGWRREGNEPLQNLDLITPLVELWEGRPRGWAIEHVRGHQTGASVEAHGNNWVDRAAVAASLGSPARNLSIGAPPRVQTQPQTQIPASTSTVNATPIQKTLTSMFPKQRTGPLQQTDIRNWFGGV